MFASVTGRVGRKGIGRSPDPLFICEKCEILCSEDLKSLFFLGSAHITIYAPNEFKSRDSVLRKTERRTKFLASFDRINESGFEVRHAGSSLFLELYLSEGDMMSLMPELDKALNSNVLQLHTSFQFPVEGLADGSGHPFSFSSFAKGDPIYFLGLPDMQLVQPAV